jgi:hypothetical protein
MPIKLLVWNIQKFTLNTIDFFKKQLELSDRFFALSRSAYILDNVTKLDPDIFVVIEVQSARGVKGSLLPANGIGGQGCLALLAALKTTNENWRLVPPLKLVPKTVVQNTKGRHSELGTQSAIVNPNNFTEVIGVFFRSDRWAFQGPYVWPASDPSTPGSKRAVPNGAGVQTADYPPEWQQALGTDASGDPNRFAGQFEYFKPRDSQEKNDEIGFPFEKHRSPFTTQFRRLGKPEVLTLVSVHFPPDNSMASHALGKTLEYFSKGNYKRQEKEIVLMAGDFNVDIADLLSAASKVASKKRKRSAEASAQFLVKETLRTTGFAIGWTKNSPPTILRPTVKMRFSNPATLDEYLGSSLDNFAVRPPVFKENMRYMVIDRVMGTKINDELFLPSLMLAKPDILQDIKPQEKQNRVFRENQNYKHLGPNPGTSDHMALYIEILLA